MCDRHLFPLFPMLHVDQNNNKIIINFFYSTNFSSGQTSASPPGTLHLRHHEGSKDLRNRDSRGSRGSGTRDSTSPGKSNQLFHFLLSYFKVTS